MYNNANLQTKEVLIFNTGIYDIYCNAFVNLLAIYISFVQTGVVFRMLNTRARGYESTQKKGTLFYCELEQ